MLTNLIPDTCTYEKNFHSDSKFECRIAKWKINILISEILLVRKLGAKKNISQEMLPIFRENTVNVTHKRKKNMKKLISPSLCLRATKNDCSIKKRNVSCDICKKLVTFTKYVCHATKRKYKMSNTKNIICLMARKCVAKNIGSAVGCKGRLLIPVIKLGVVVPNHFSVFVI